VGRPADTAAVVAVDLGGAVVPDAALVGEDVGLAV